MSHKITIRTLIATFLVSNLLSLAYGTALTPQQKQDSIRSEVPVCISKQSQNRVGMDSNMQQGIRNYCECHARAFASMATQEEYLEVSRGRIPNSMRLKVEEAQKTCITKLSR